MYFLSIFLIYFQSIYPVRLINFMYQQYSFNLLIKVMTDTAKVNWANI